MSNKNLLTSPVGEIQFLAAENPVKETSGKQVYTIKLAFDVKKDAAWLEQVSKINDAKVVTERTYRGKSDAIKAVLASGKALVGANSIYKPEVFDAEGNTMEESPSFYSDSKGTAQMIVQPYQGDKGGTINLIGIIIHSIENTESSGDGTDRATRIEQLRAVVKAATKG